MRKNSKTIKFLITMMIAVVMLGGNCKVHAANGKVSAGDIFTAASNWITTGNNEAAGMSGTSVDDFADALVGVGQILVAIAIGTLVIVSVIMAIKWITATPDKKAKLQQQLIGLVVATFVIFGALGIWNLVRDIMGNVEGKLNANVNNQSIVVAQNKGGI